MKYQCILFNLQGYRLDIVSLNIAIAAQRLTAQSLFAHQKVELKVLKITLLLTVLTNDEIKILIII